MIGKLIDAFMGSALIIISIITFMLVGCMVDGLAISTFLKWEAFACAMLILGAMLIKLSKMG